MRNSLSFLRKIALFLAVISVFPLSLLVTPAYAAEFSPTETSRNSAEVTSSNQSISGTDGEVPTHSDENINPDQVHAAPTAIDNLEDDMTRTASAWGFGQATSSKIGIGSGYWLMFFQSGTVVYSPGKGSVPMAHQVYQRWIETNRSSWGPPLYAERINRGIKTYFANGAYVFDTNSQLIMRADQHIDSQDILTIGDSQVSIESWVGQGIAQAGYTPWFFRCGGTGFVEKRLDENCKFTQPDGRETYSDGSEKPFAGNINYTEGVVNNRWFLPDGAPKAIYIQGSGNDRHYNFDEVTANAHATIQTLKKIYPNTQIILTDTISADTSTLSSAEAEKFTANSNYLRRGPLSDRLRKLAQDDGITFISYKWWITDYGVQNKLADSLHFKDAEQYRLAPYVRDSLLAALQGYTLQGGVGEYYSNTGGTARYGVPTSNEISLGNGAVYQSFSKGYSIYWSPNTGAHAVKFSGSIGQAFRSTGYEHTSGFPYMDETAISGGSMQKFRNAAGQVSAFYWSPSYGTYRVWEGGAIGAKFTRDGGTGIYGFPVEGETSVAPNGARQSFILNEKVTRMYWSPQTGVHTMNGRGAIFAHWVASGDGAGLGFPVTEEISAGNGGSVQFTRTQDGREFGIYWSSRSGAHHLNSKGALYNYYLSHGYTSTFGFPVEDEYVGTDGRIHLKFSSGQELTWSAWEGARVR